jgi:hypothetical protein
MLELAEHGGNQFGHRRVDVNGTLDDGIGRLGVHDVKNRVNGLVAAGAEDGGAKNLFGCGRRPVPS